MYQIKCDNSVLYDPRDKSLLVESPLLSLEVNKVGELSFTIPSGHPGYDSITKFASNIRLYRDSVLVFKGRAWSDEQDTYKSKDIQCEGALAFLRDSRIRPFEFTGTITQFLTKIITEHNAQVEAHQRFTLGIVTVTDPNNYIARSSVDYLSAWDVIESRLVKTNAGYISLRFDASENCIIDYLADFTDTSTQVIKFGENIVDLVKKNSGEKMYTAVIPLGAKISDINPDSDDDSRLTVESVNDGKDYIVNATLAAQYGVIYAPVSETLWEDVTLAANLYAKGLDYLNNTATRWMQTVSITAIDLHNTDATIEQFNFCDKVRVISTPHDIDQVYLLSEIKIPLNNPAETRITLGESVPTYVGDSVRKNKNIDTRVYTIEQDYTTRAKVEALAAEVVNKNTSILQSAEQIILSALENYAKTQDFSTFQSTVQTQFDVMAGQIDMVFTTTTSDISTLDGDTKQQFDNITKYIRFIDGAIVLGQSDSLIKLRIENDILYFFAGADDAADVGTAFAYFAAGKLYVNDAEIVTSLKIGNFAFLPRANGNLSFRKAN